jgi:multiple sugar transport system substrate-binding protein
MSSFIPSRLTRRSLAKAGLIGSAALPLPACGGDRIGGDSGGGSDAEDTGEITFMWWGGDERHAYTNELIELFEAANDGVSVTPNPAEFSGYWDALAVSTGGGSAPDVLQHDDRYLREYAERGALADLEEIGVDLSDIDPLALPGGQLDGKTYGVACGVNSFCMYANPALFDEAGVDLPDDANWTWDEFVDLSEELGAKTDAVGCQTLFAFNEATFNIYARQRGQSLWSEDGTLGFDQDLLVEYFTMLQDLAGRDGAAPAATQIVETQAGGLDQSLLVQGQAAMEFHWTNQLGGITGTLGSDMVLLRAPGEFQHQQPGMYLRPAMFWAISSTTKAPQTSAALVNYLLNGDEAIDLIKTDRGLPSNLTQRSRILPALSETDAQGAAFIETITPDLVSIPPVPPIGAGEVPSIMQRVAEGLLFEQYGPADAAEQFVNEVNGVIG